MVEPIEVYQKRLKNLKRERLLLHKAVKEKQGFAQGILYQTYSQTIQSLEELIAYLTKTAAKRKAEQSEYEEIRELAAFIKEQEKNAPNISTLTGKPYENLTETHPEWFQDME